MAVRFSAASQNYTASTGLPGNVYTLTAWIQPVIVGGANRVVYWLRASGDVFTGVEIRPNASTDLQAYDSGIYSFNGLGALPATAGTWYRIALVVNGANATFYRAAAGTALGSASAADFTTPATPSGLYLGDDPYDEYFDGRIAAVKVWAAALTAAEVEAELAQYVPSRTADLLRFHPFLSAESTDYSGNGNTLSDGVGASTEDGPPIPWRASTPRLTRLAPTGVARDLAGDLPAATDLAGALTRQVGLAATLGAAADAAGTVTAQRGLAGQGAASANLAGALSVARSLDATLAAAADLGGGLALARTLAAVLPAAAAARGGLQVQRDLAGTIPAAATFVGLSGANWPPTAGLPRVVDRITAGTARVV